MSSSKLKRAADEPLLLTVDQVAHLIQLGTRTVWRLSSSGVLPRPIAIGGSRRWERRAILEWIRERVAEKGGRR